MTSMTEFFLPCFGMSQVWSSVSARFDSSVCAGSASRSDSRSHHCVFAGGRGCQLELCPLRRLLLRSTWPHVHSAAHAGCSAESGPYDAARCFASRPVRSERRHRSVCADHSLPVRAARCRLCESQLTSVNHALNADGSNAMHSLLKCCRPLRTLCGRLRLSSTRRMLTAARAPLCLCSNF
jgi:hypothetical protein